VHVSTERDDGRVRISVRDNGIGIDPDHADQIFKMFQRLHSSDEYPGTGIGLAIAKKIVDRHGGRFVVEPAPGGGTIFSFDIPAEMPR
jgi:signal transduction histidine kinase